MGLLCMCLTTKTVQITSDSDLWKLCIDIDHVFITIYIVMDFLLSSPKWKCEKLPGKTGPEPEKGFFLYSSSSHTVTGKTIWKRPTFVSPVHRIFVWESWELSSFWPFGQKGPKQPFSKQRPPMAYMEQYMAYMAKTSADPTEALKQQKVQHCFLCFQVYSWFSVWFSAVPKPLTWLNKSVQTDNVNDTGSHLFLNFFHNVQMFEIFQPTSVSQLLLRAS